ncbi:MAG: endonuclease Q family protein [Thermoproteota archaeon]
MLRFSETCGSSIANLISQSILTRSGLLLKNEDCQSSYYVDMHIHSKYSRATSMDMTLENIAFCARLKGLNIVGTGDCTHPKWLRELRNKLVEFRSGLYSIKGGKQPVLFLLQGEVSTIYIDRGSVKRIHHVIIFPDLGSVEQACEALKILGDLKADGRPTLKCSSPELIEILMEVSENIEAFPAHVWTPHFSIFGKHGYTSVKDCYKDKADRIHALETGLSSDPPMNWRVSRNDRYALVSNSDSHSYYPWRLGREANLILLEELGYKAIVDAIRRRGKSRIILTIETYPEYGKYHYPGHRSCSFSAGPEEYFKLKGICPVCDKKLTPGVETHIEELADRERGIRPRDASDYVHVIPLSELISYVYSINPDSRKVWGIYYELTDKLGSEYSILLEVPVKKIAEYDRNVAKAIEMVRRGKVRVKPGYDGVYGEIEGLSSKENIRSFFKE